MARKKANGEGSIFPVGKRWKFALTVGWTAAGRRRVKTEIHNSYSDASTALQTLRKKLADGEPIERATGSVAEYLATWLKDVVSGLAENTQESYRIAVEKHICPHLGGVRLDRLKASHVQSWLAELNRTAEPRARQNAFTVLKAAMRNAVLIGHIRATPCAAFKRPRVDRKAINPLTMAEAQKVLEATADTRVHALLRLALTTGMRQGELFGLQWESVDLSAGRLTVREQAIFVANQLVVRKPKSAKSWRVLELTPAAVNALHDHRAILLRSKLAGNPLVFPANHGGHQRSSSLRKQWRKLLESQEIAYRGFHHTRHTFATLALGAGVPLHVVSKILGHAQASTTLNIYAHVLQQQQAAATASMQQMFG